MTFFPQNCSEVPGKVMKRPCAPFSRFHDKRRNPCSQAPRKKNQSQKRNDSERRSGPVRYRFRRWAPDAPTAFSSSVTRFPLISSFSLLIGRSICVSVLYADSQPLTSIVLLKFSLTRVWIEPSNSSYQVTWVKETPPPSGWARLPLISEIGWKSSNLPHDHVRTWSR